MDPQDQPQDAQNSSQEELIDYQDIFEQARREEVLQQINQENSSQLHNVDVELIMNKQQRRKEKQQKYEQQNEMKRLRQQNALHFFVKIKARILLSVKDSIIKANQIQTKGRNKVARLLSQCSFQTVISYQNLKNKANLITREEFIDFTRQIFIKDKIQLEGQSKYEVIWSFAQVLIVPFRQLSFIDISDMNLQSFYNLQYATIKSKNKKVDKQLDILKSRLQRQASEEEIKDKSFVSIQQYSFRPGVVSQPNFPTKTSSSLSQSQLLRQIKRTFLNSFCFLFCSVKQDWSLFNMDTMQIYEIQQIKRRVIEGRAVIGFYSTRLMNFKAQYQALKRERNMGKIQLIDYTNQFCDKDESIMRRRNRLGCKGIYKNIFRESNTFKTLKVFSDLDQLLIEKQKDKYYKWAISNFPKSVRQMKMSDEFVTNSLIDKYMILREGAIYLPNLQFKEQRVYLKSDLQRVSSKMGWIDCGRMVKDGQIPVKTTQNKNKVTTKLYNFGQTQSFRLKLDEQENLLLDQEYNSIYVPPHFQIPEGFELIVSNVEYLCRKHKYKCARIVQGFDVAGSHIVPNNIGFLVEKQYQKQITKLYQEKQQKLKVKKEQRKIQQAMFLWRKLFKSILITQQINAN